MQARGVGKGGLNRPPIESPMAICHSVRGDQYSVVQLRQEQRHRNLKQISELSIVDACFSSNPYPNPSFTFRASLFRSLGA